MNPQTVKIAEAWRKHLEPEFAKPYFDELAGFVKQEYNTNQVFPPPKLIFNAFEHCSFAAVKIVILGQDPYHGPKQAHGLAFSVTKDVPIPPSLQNIYKEIQADLGTPIPQTGDLTRWADQGVLLLNATLTVRAYQPGSHQGKGWEQFTDAVIRVLNGAKEHLVFMLWGSYARQKGAFIDRNRHLVLEAPHPSPFSANKGFFGSKHFSQANAYLVKHGKQPISW